MSASPPAFPDDADPLHGELGLFDPEFPGPRRRPRRLEDKLHAGIWRDLRWHLDPEVVVCWSSENRGVGITEGQRRRARGVIAGVPDMVFHWPHAAIAYVELKTGKGTRNEAQKELHRRLTRAGVPVAVCRSLDDTLRFLREQGCPLRGRITA